MRWLITGGTGLVGRYLVDQLMGSGHRIDVVTRDAAGLRTGAKAIIADLAQTDWPERAGIDPDAYDAVCHLAYATSGVAAYDRQVTVDSVKALLNHFAASSLQHFVYLGSMVVFGEKTPPGPLDETAPRLPETDYARNKVDATGAVLDFPAPFRVSVLHPTGVYDTDSKRLRDYVELMRHGYLAGPLSGLSNIVHASDVAAAIIACAARIGGGRAEEYVINGEAIRFDKWLAVLEQRAGVNENLRLPVLVSSFVRGPLARLARRMGLRRAIHVPPYKSAIYQLKTVYSSQKAMRDFGFRPQKFFDGTT